MLRIYKSFKNYRNCCIIKQTWLFLLWAYVTLYRDVTSRQTAQAGPKQEIRPEMKLPHIISGCCRSDCEYQKTSEMRLRLYEATIWKPVRTRRALVTVGISSRMRSSQLEHLREENLMFSKGSICLFQSHSRCNEEKDVTVTLQSLQLGFTGNKSRPITWWISYSSFSQSLRANVEVVTAKPVTAVSFQIFI
jgi:hypothetical protein